jgi:nitroimidazol reductase NimA-like FMN-containing flavoprotein (pyridoxamine 5'-phosphate oxidase superfamily)
MFEHLSQSECLARLVAGRVGRVGVVVEDAPHVLPVNYSSDPTGVVVFRTAEGTLLTRVDGRAVVFEIDGFDTQKAIGWSVCVHGRGHEVTTPSATATRSLVDRGLISWAPGPRDRWFSITPDELTGRRVELTGDLSDLGWIEGVVS